MKKYTYKILEHHNDPMKAVIQKSGLTAEFTLAQLETEKKQWQMMIDKYKSERSVDLAKMENVQDHHPFVLEMSDEERSHVWLYQTSKVGVDVCDQKIKAYEEEMREVDKTIKEIAKKLGLRHKEEIVQEAVDKITEVKHG